VIDQSGNLYGTALGAANCGVVTCGLVFELSQVQGGSWSQLVFYNFQGQRDGAAPVAPVIFDAQGNLYGTTSGATFYNQGVAFKLSPPSAPGSQWAQTVLHSFGVLPNDGAQPKAGLTPGPNGTLLGTTLTGGTFGFGTVYGLRPPSSPGGSWKYGVLYSFSGGDGAFPEAGLTLLPPGSVFGTTSAGGAFGNGTVFQMSNAAGGKLSETALYSFGGNDGAGPAATVILQNNQLYGTTVNGGFKNDGVVFELSY